jgi:predicted flap endonuclease-1-like 5' DNA nuclease
MRLDYTLYILAAILLIITVVPFVAPIGVETTETRSIWVVASVVLGLLSIGLGYTQRPRTEAQACQQATPEAQQVTTMKAPKEETEASMEKPPAKTAPAPAASMAATMDLTQVKGIGEKRAVQLKALGINSVEDLSKASVKTVADKLKISPKTVSKWVATAKELAE